MPVRVQALDHLVLNVADPAASARWYSDRLGCAVEREAEWRAGEAPFLSVRLDEGTIIDLFEADRAEANLDHFCVVVDPSTDLDAVATDGEFDVERGPVTVWGARGYGESVYVRDPDGNTVELRVYAD